jgi:hypothetical protein
VARRIVDCHLATMERLGIHMTCSHESDILRLHFGTGPSSPKEKARSAEAEGKSALLGPVDG